MMNVKRWFLNNSLRNYQYMLYDDKHAIVIDPLKFDVFDDFITSNNLELSAILITHKHGDHIAGVKKLSDKYPESKVYAYTDNEMFKPDIYVNDTDHIDLGFTSFRVFYTPGHISDHVCYLFDNEKALFCGDTVFNAGVGGVHDKTANTIQLGQSIQKILTLNSDIKLYSAHDYWKNNLAFALSILPNDSDFKYYMDNIADLSADDKPIITLAEESTCNIFMRSFSDKSLQDTYPDCELGLEMFIKMRNLKNEF